MQLVLERFSYAPTETEGQLFVANYTFASLEPPWIPYKDLGGKPFASCVPDGTYALAPFKRVKDGSDSYVLINTALGVFPEEESMRGAGEGRYACLIHAANFVFQLVGCIAPGMSRGILKNNGSGSYERAVLSSNDAMRIIRGLVDPSETRTYSLVIRPRSGAGGTA